jgi:hypothetical protein
MRFPWLQVDLDFITAHSRDLAALLGVSRREAIGLAVDLWTWALGRTTNDAPPTGEIVHPQAARLVAGAVDWSGDAEALCGALAASGLLECIPGGVRIRGMSRYTRTWEKNGRRKPQASAVPVAGEKPAECAPVPAPKTQIEKKIEDPASQEPLAAPEREELRLTSPASKKQRKQSEAEALFDLLQSHRKQRCEEVGEEFVFEEWPHARRNRDLGAIVRRDHAGKLRFEAAWGLYLADDGERVREPAWSLSWFMQSGVLARYETRAAREEAA